MSVRDEFILEIIESIPTMLGYCDRDMRFRYANRAYLEWHNQTLDNILDKTILEIVGEAYFNKIASKVEAVLAGKNQRFEVQQITAKGDIRWVQAHYIADVRADLTVRGFFIATQDISDHLNSGVTVQALFLQVFENGPMGIALVDGNFCLTSVNARFSHMLGYSEEEILGRSFLELTHPDDRSKGARSTQSVFGGEVKVFSQDKRYLCKDGSIIDASVTVSAINDDEGRPLMAIAVIEDITKRLQTEERLRQSQRVAATGELAGGLAHDFNNLLSIILGNADLVTEKLAKYSEAGSDCQRLLESIIAAAERGAAITHRLLAFSRKQPLEPEILDLNSVLAQMNQLIRHSVVGNIEIEMIQHAGLWRCEIDRSQVENVLVNLAVNARDAMPDGGKMTIETANVVLDDEYVIDCDDLVSGQYVMLAVTDNGTGMSEEVIGQVIEPFFTTKDVGHGSGLGLSMVYGFVKQSGGHLSIYSEIGEGTTVKLYLPRSLAGLGDRDITQWSIPDSDGNGQQILLIEDNLDLRVLTASMLSGLGYTVFQAGNGQEALVLFNEQPDIELLLTDVVLPGGMGGNQIAEALQAQRPSLKVLYMSGYTDNSIVHNGRLDQKAVLLQKPFRKQALMRKIQQVITDQGDR